MTLFKLQHMCRNLAFLHPLSNIFLMLHFIHVFSFVSSHMDMAEYLFHVLVCLLSTVNKVPGPWSPQ